MVEPRRSLGVGGTLCALTSLPPLLGILFWGVVWASLPHRLTTSIPSSLFAIARTVGAGVIMLLAGLSLDIPALRNVVGKACLMAFVPTLVEASVRATLCMALFPDGDMTWNAAWLLGFALAGSSPGIIVPAGTFLQARGHGVRSGVLAMLYTASSLNVALCIGVFEVLFTATFKMGRQNTSAVGETLGVLLRVGVGSIAGVLMGYTLYLFCILLNARRTEKNEPYYATDRYIVVFIVGACLAFVFNSGHEGASDFPAGGILGVLTMSVSFNYLTTHNVRKNPSLLLVKRDVVSHVSFFWDTLIQPFFFSLVGASTTFHQLFVGDHFAKSIGLFACGYVAVCIAIVVCFKVFVRHDSFSNHDLVYIAVAWLGKGTPQAALAGILAARYGQLSDSPAAKLILNECILAIFLFGPLSAVLMRVLWSKTPHRRPRDHAGPRGGNEKSIKFPSSTWGGLFLISRRLIRTSPSTPTLRPSHFNHGPASRVFLLTLTNPTAQPRKRSTALHSGRLGIRFKY